MIWVGRLERGAAAIAGVGIAGMVVQVVGAARMGLQTGTRAIVARSIGAGNEQEANHVAQQYFLISIAFGILMAALGFFSRQILLLLGLESDVVTQGTAYLRIQLFGMVTMSFQMMSQSLMQASGDAKTPMWISIGSGIVDTLQRTDPAAANDEKLQIRWQDDMAHSKNRHPRGNKLDGENCV